MFHHLLILLTTIVLVSGHGRLLHPPSRASLWRYDPRAKPNYDDSGLNCGGVTRQHVRNGGKCGICGDPYDMRPPRPHELGGTYGQGIIVASYQAEETFDVTVDITAFHHGYWVFKICPDRNSIAQSCFDRFPVQLKHGGYKFFPPKGGKYTIKYRLPKGLHCEHCVLQWRYIAGNNWGVCRNGTEGMGCGDQETFGACSDISISSPNYIQGGKTPINLAYVGDVDEDLLDFLRKMTKKTVPKKHTGLSNKHKKKKKNSRKPRDEDGGMHNKHSKRKKTPFWR